MPQPLKVLIVEDRAADAELVLRTLRRAGFEPEWERVETEADFASRLHAGLDLVLSDHELPQFSGQRALEILKQSGLHIPFILVSGTIGEEAAVAAMKLGAADYLLKDRLARLGQSVTHALEQSRLLRERIRTEAELREANAHLHHLVARSPTVIYSLILAEGNGRMNYVSPNVATLTGFSEKETLRPEWWQARLHPDDQASALAALRLAVAEGQGRTEYRIRNKHDAYIWVEDRQRLLPSVDGRPPEIVGGWTDITARKEAEEALRESVDRFRQLAENIQEVFWIIDPAENAILYISPAYEKIWGRTCESLRQAPLTWLDTIHPEDREAVVAAWQTKRTRSDYNEIYRILRPDGTVRWIRDRAYPLRDASGQVFRIVGTAEDITERRQLEAQFQQAQKMEALGTLAGGIAHDFNNILSGIQGYAELAKMRLKDNPVAASYLSRLERGVNRASILVRQILAFSRRQEPRRTLVDLRQAVAEPLELLRATVPSTIEFDVVLQENLPAVLADATQVHQVVMNLCTNAWHAMKDRPGRLQLRMEAFEVDASLARTNSRLHAGPYVRLTVSDTGHGMSRATLERIFEPFFTTKGPGEGTGLGLAAVDGIMQTHEGAITVDSQPGVGTTFQLYFPARVGEASETGGRAPEILRGHGQHVLFVDDEETLAELGRDMLEELGYTVTACSRARTALELVRAAPGRFDLVITDLTMPEMVGTELAAQLQGLRPDLPVILSSGYTASVTPAHLQAGGIREVLLKPHSLHSLGSCAERVLRGKV